MQVQQQPYPDDRYDVDYEKHGASRESNPLPDLKRKLKSRHLQMIAIGEYQLPYPSTRRKIFSVSLYSQSHKVVPSERACSLAAARLSLMLVPSAP